MSDSKTCKKCQQQIDQLAQVCPHCKMPQSFWSHIKIILPFILAFGFLIVTVDVVSNWYYQKQDPLSQPCQQTTTETFSIETKQHALQIKSSEVSFIEGEQRNQIVVLGLLENSSEKTWKSLSFEVRFFDENDVMIDAFSSIEYYLAVTPNSESSFRLIELAAKPLGSYHHHQVKITDASVVSDSY